MTPGKSSEHFGRLASLWYFVSGGRLGFLSRYPLRQREAVRVSPLEPFVLDQAEQVSTQGLEHSLLLGAEFDHQGGLLQV